MARILLIDDDDLLRGVLAKALAHNGHEVVQAENGRQGIEIARVNDFNLVITDLIMPVQEGVETIIMLHKEQPELPIIAMSGGTSHTSVYLDVASKIGARCVLSKPFTPHELVTAIAEVLSPGGAT
jgi:DNA-binding response OmpR family regulator